MRWTWLQEIHGTVLVGRLTSVVSLGCPKQVQYMVTWQDPLPTALKEGWLVTTFCNSVNVIADLLKTCELYDSDPKPTIVIPKMKRGKGAKEAAGGKKKGKSTKPTKSILEADHSFF